MTDLSWKEAAIEVLAEHPGEAMYYADIADAIAQRGLVKSAGATPVLTLKSVLAATTEGGGSPFIKAARGYYALRGDMAHGYEIKSLPVAAPRETGLINAFGMYWERRKVRWRQHPKLLGKQQGASITVDFFGQRGVYILYDRHRPVYAGRAEKDTLGERLREHGQSRLAGRWNRFSWFGVYPVQEDGRLDTSVRVREDVFMMLATMEALLIETHEPPQNRRRGDYLAASEFWQVKDPDLKKDELLEIARLLRRNMREINRRE